MRLARRISQVIFIILFFLLFLAASYPLKTWLPVDFFLRMDALAMLSSGLAGRFFIFSFLPALIVLVMTIFMGRFFCGWICPLGTTLDAGDSLFRWKSGNRKNTKLYRYRFIKYFILAVILVISVFSLDLAGWLSPIPLFTRSMIAVIYPGLVFLVFGLFDILYKIPFLETPVSSVQEFLTGLMMPVTQPVFRGFWVMAVMFGIILGLSAVTRRFWCRNLCPLGALLGVSSGFRLYRRGVSESCTDCGKCHANCRMGAIPVDAHKTDHVECINCMDCRDICPANAITFKFIQKVTPEPVDLSRRRLLGAGLTGMAVLGLTGIGFSNPVKKGKMIRPPGALEEDRFLDRCVRCGACIRVCSTAGKGLQFAGTEAGLAGLGTPLLLTPAGYCEYNCTMCGEVCPTGAIHKLPLEIKHDVSRIKMGTAQFDKTRCIPWYYGETCLVCEEHCPLDEKAIKFRESSIVTIDGRENRVLLPYVDESLCMGCGICTTVCPLSAEKGIFLTNAGEQRWMEGFEAGL